MLGAGAGKTECGGGEDVAGDTEDREGFGQTAGHGFCPGLLSGLLYLAKKNNKQGFFLISGCMCYYNLVLN